ncbi:MAG: biotin-dependent carboxyltransferase family protein [Peptococcaceae bacterium]
MGLMKVISPGFLSTFQDLGRFGYQKYGMPVAGAMDEYSLRVANLLVGNREGEACLEITLLGPSLEFTAESVIALTGADLGAALNGRKLPLWQTIHLHKGDRLEFGGIKAGCRTYLAVAGGFNIPEVMESKSTYMRGKMGGYQGRALKKADEVSIPLPSREALRRVNSKVPEEYLYNFTGPEPVRVVLGPQDAAFSKEGIMTFLNSSYQVTNQADRMGYRLKGPKIEHRSSPDIISDGIAPGAVQVPGEGMPIIMMADRQTIGGYTKIATIISADLPKVAQAKPGDALRFQAVSLAEARQIAERFTNTLRLIKDYLLAPGQLKKVRHLKVKINDKEFFLAVQEIPQ